MALGMTDFEQIVRAERGDHAAFEHLYARYSPLVWRIARRRLRCPIKAAEALSEVFTWLLTRRWRCNPDIVDADGRIDRFVATLATYASQKVGWLPFDQSRAEQDAQFIFARLPAKMRTPEELFLAREVRRRVRDAINGLTPQMRRVAILRYLRELSGPEIAERLGVDNATIPGYLHQVRTRMKQALPDLVPDGPTTNDRIDRAERYGRATA